MAKPFNLTPEELRQLLRYEASTGKLYWRERGAEWFSDGFHTAQASANQWNARYAGREAGTVHKRGYVHLRLPRHKTQQKAHRVILFMETGVMPNVCDHIDGDNANNRLANLRSVTQAENAKNCRMWSHNTSGQNGVTWHRGKRKWTAQIRSGGKQIALGTFATFEEAVAARKDAEVELGFHENHGRAS